MGWGHQSSAIFRAVIPATSLRGFFAVWFQQPAERREALESVYPLWTPGERNMAQLEMLMIIHALSNRPSEFRNRRGVWFVDNVAVLIMSVIKGRSPSEDMGHMVRIINTFLFALRAVIFCEWVPVTSNWSDAISRLGFNDPWFKTHGLVPCLAGFHPDLWSPPLVALIRVAELF